MTDWNYKRDDTQYAREGNYWATITGAEEKKSKSGNDMLVVTLEIDGTATTIKDYFVQGEYFNRRITKFFDAFKNIADGDFSYPKWIGKKAAVSLKKDDKGYLKIGRYIASDDVAIKDMSAPEPETEYLDPDTADVPF